jgi:hypothetical protein
MDLVPRGILIRSVICLTGDEPHLAFSDPVPDQPVMYEIREFNARLPN